MPERKNAGRAAERPRLFLSAVYGMIEYVQILEYNERNFSVLKPGRRLSRLIDVRRKNMILEGMTMKRNLVKMMMAAAALGVTAAPVSGLAMTSYGGVWQQ